MMGTSIPSTSGKYIKSGAVDKMFFWDPAITGTVLLTVANKLSKGEKVGAGTDLKIEGYNDLKKVEGTGNSFHGAAWIDVDAANLSEYNF